MSMEFLIKKENGSKIAGYYSPASNPVDKLDKFVVISSAFCADSNQYPVYAKFAKAASEVGYDVARFDFSGLGKSSGEFQDTTMRSQMFDLATVINELSSNNPVCVVGHNMGGIISTNVAARKLNVEAVALWNSPTDMKKYHNLYKSEIKSNGYIVRKRGNKNIKVGKAMWEEFAYVEHSSQPFIDLPVFALFGSEDEDKIPKFNTKYFQKSLNHQVVTLKDADHNFEKPNAAEATIKLTIDWLKRNF